MLPMIEAGLLQRAGEDVGDVQVKRQTIRRRGKRNAELITGYSEFAPLYRPGLDLDLWWKSRTKEKRKLGYVRQWEWSICALDIRLGVTGVLRISGQPGWRTGLSTMAWEPGQPGGSPVEAFARADGFGSVEAFRNYFVPNRGDVFEGVLFRW